MSGINASLWRRGALALLAGAVLAIPLGAKADITKGLSFRVGGFMPVRGREANSGPGLRDITDFGVLGGGVDYKIPFPSLLNGEHWSTSISADLFYSERNRGIFRYIPVAINQVYTFEEKGGVAPFLGFSIVAATFGANGIPDGEGGTMGTPMVTRFGGGLILGANLPGRLYVESRYEWIDKHATPINPEGWRLMVGYRF